MTDDLRKRAEAFLNTNPEETPTVSTADVKRLVHELQVHQVELEMQNEELRRAQAELADSRDRYVDLYELAPVGYVTLDQNRIVREANLTVCKLLGVEREQVIGRKIEAFAAPAHRDECFRRFRNTLRSGVEQSFEMEFQGNDNAIFWGQVKCVPREQDTSWPGGCRGTMSDITERKEMETLLYRNEERLRTVVDGGELGTWDRDLVTDETVWNDFLYDMLGRKRGTPINGETFFEYIHSEDLARVREHVEQQIESANDFVDEFRVVREDGRVRWLAARGRITRDAGGRPVRMAGVNYDVTDRKRAEDAVRVAHALARERLREIEDLYSNAPVGLCVLDRELRYVRINARLAEINGVPAAEHIGKTVREVLPQIADAVESNMFQVLETGEPRLDVEFVGETPAKPGVERSWLEQWLPVRDDEGRVTGINIVAEETTERKQAEEAVRESQKKLALAASGTQIGIFDRSIATGEIAATDQNVRLLGLRTTTTTTTTTTTLSQHYHYRDWAERVHPEDLPRVEAEMGRCMRERAPFETEYRVVWPDESVHWLAARGVFQYGEDGRPQRMLGILMDITGRRAAEEQLQRHAQELEAFNQRMVGRELRMVELKKEVNALCEQLGRPPEYRADFLRENPPATIPERKTPNDSPQATQAGGQTNDGSEATQ